jgi:hypothetical protein
MRRRDPGTSGLDAGHWLPEFGLRLRGMNPLLLSLLILLFLVQGCAAPPERSHPLPPALGLKAEIPGIPHARQR